MGDGWCPTPHPPSLRLQPLLPGKAGGVTNTTAQRASGDGKQVQKEKSLMSACYHQPCPDDNKLTAMSVFIPESNKDKDKRAEIHTEVQP